MKKLFALFLALLILCSCGENRPVDMEANSVEIIPGTTYIASEAVFRSMYTGIVGITYAEYEIKEDSFVFRYDYNEKVYEISEWKWLDFSCTEEQWLSLFDEWEEPVEIFRYGKIMYQPVDDFNFFLLVNGEIWSVSIFPYGPEGEWRIVMIDMLTKIDSAGSVQWEYAPTMSSKEPFFDFEIRVDFSRISASGINVVDVDKPYFQLGSNIVIDDHNFIRWSPADYDGTISSGSEINFCIFQNGDNTSWRHSGKIAIKTVESNDGKTVFEATLVSPDLVLKMDENTGKAYICAKDT